MIINSSLILLVNAINRVIKPNIDYVAILSGVFGTAIGTIIGLIFSIIKDNMGKVYVEVNDYRDEKDGEKFAYCFSLYLFNMSYQTKIFKDIEICYYKNPKLCIKSIPKSGDTFLYINKQPKLEPICIEGKHHVKMQICGLIDKEEYQKLECCQSIKLLYKHEKGKIKKKIINKSKFSFYSVKTVADAIL